MVCEIQIVMSTMRVMLLLLAMMAAPSNAALLRSRTMGVDRARKAALTMCAAQRSGIDVERNRLHRDVVESFVAATERGDAAAAMALCTDDFYYKTHRATTDSLAAAEERLHTKTPAPSKVTEELHEDSCTVTEELHEDACTLIREIVVKPIPFVTVTVEQQFEVRNTVDGGAKLCRAEYIKQ